MVPPETRRISMSVVIDDEVLNATGLTEAELRLELAVLLFEMERLTMARAARLAALPLAAFMRVLGSRGVSPHYDVEELRADLEVVDRLTQP